MLTDSSESLFAYNNPGESFENFMDMSFEPVFAPEFEDPELERRADEICGDDQFCLFDIAATGTLDIGMATMSGVRDFDMIVIAFAPNTPTEILQLFCPHQALDLPLPQGSWLCGSILVYIAIISTR